MTLSSEIGTKQLRIDDNVNLEFDEKMEGVVRKHSHLVILKDAQCQQLSTGSDTVVPMKAEFLEALSDASKISTPGLSF